MSGEVRFANENEASSCFSDSFVKVLVHSKAAFALLRKGCRHCWGRTPGGGEALRQAEEAEVRPFFRKSEHRSKTLVSLRQVPAEKQAVVVAFLTRIAEIRRGALRRVQERHLPPSLSTPYIYIYIWSGVWRSQPPPPPNGMVWYGVGGGGGWRVRRGVGAVGAAAGETARRHRQGRHSTQALRKP